MLMTSPDSKNMATSNVAFMKRCSLLKAHQRIQIFHVLCYLGHISLSEQWLREAIDALKEIGMPDVISEAAEVAMYIMYIIMKGSRDQENNALVNGSSGIVANPLDFYESGASFLEGNDEKLRFTAHKGMALLQKGLQIDAYSTLNKATNYIRNPTGPPILHQELLDAIDALVIINVKQDEMDKALDGLKLRLELVSRCEVDYSVKLTKELLRLGCFYCVLGDNAECIKQLDESLRILFSSESVDLNVSLEIILDAAKLLAVSYDVLGEDAGAVDYYNLAIDKETDSIKKTKLMNAISHLYCRSEKCSLAIDYLDKSLALQKIETRNYDENTSLLIDTLILYGNAMASKKSYTEARFWYEYALDANTDKSPREPNNLRAWYNSGIALFHSGNIVGASHVFWAIDDTVGGNPHQPREKEHWPNRGCGGNQKPTTQGFYYVRNGIGNIHFVNMSYGKAIEFYGESLSTENHLFTPCQRAVTLCSIAMAEYLMGNFEGSKLSTKHALRIAKSMDDSHWEAKSIIFSKVACVCFERKGYGRAFSMYSEGKR